MKRRELNLKRSIKRSFINLIQILNLFQTKLIHCRENKIKTKQTFTAA
jgi:hypothetical protein